MNIIVRLVLLIFIISQINHSVIAHGISDNENCGRLSPSVRHYIYGGKSAQIEQWPWQLHMKITDNEHSIMENDHANCGATLIDDNWIITAAHCFSGHRIPKLYLLNGHNFTVYDNYKLIKYDRIVIHPDYYEYSGQHEYSTNDIALVKLSDENKFDRSIPKPCLPKQDSIIPINSICYITGFGAMNKNDNQVIKRIREGRVAIKNDKICTRTLSLTFYDRRTMMCAGRAKGSKANSCQGDSGGPLVCEGSFGDSRDEQWYLFGITSFGAFDCSSYTSSVYTKVSTYVDWINKTIQYS